MKPKGTLFAYLDAIGVPSEVSFLKRFYVGFTNVDPYWVGWKLDRDSDALPQPKIMLGRSGPLRALDRLLFKTIGSMPPKPHLWHFRPRLIHAHFGRGGALALPLAQAMKVPLIVTFHGGDATKDKHYDQGLIPKIYQRRMAELQNYATAFHCVSDYIRDALLRRGFPAEKLFVLRTGVEVSPDAAPVTPAEPYVLFVGRLVEKKGLRHLIDAMELLQQRGVPIPLKVIGDGPLAGALKDHAKKRARVDFLGWQSNTEVRRWMRGATAVCVPSLMAETGDSEGLGHVTLEAMDAGVPVIASRHGGIREVVSDSENGLLVEPGNADAIASAIARIAADPTLGRALGAKGRETIRLQFDAVTQSRALEAKFLDLVADRDA
jgi:glycosyltransferase involved in cell wall biosynthesis